MNGRFRVIDEVNFNVLGSFDSRGDAVDFVATLLDVNDDDYRDELTIAGDENTPLTGHTLRDALQSRAATRERVGASGRGNATGGGYAPSTDAMAAKGYGC